MSTLSSAALLSLVLLGLGATPIQEVGPLSPVPKGPAPKGIDRKTWKSAGPEQRWVLYRQSVTQHKALVSTWISFLERNRDFQMLEAMAVYEGFHSLFQKGKPGEVLVRLDAPQWMRVALWNLRQQDSHSVEAARSPLQAQAGRFLGWAAKYPQVTRLGGRSLIARLKDTAPRDPGDQLPPLDPRTVILPFLDMPRKPAILTTDKPFDRRERYRFQTLRAIQAISVAGSFGEPFRSKLLRLTRHEDTMVRRRALVEFSEFPSAQIPWSELLTMADNPDLLAEDRRIATLAASFSNHPAVFVALHRILVEPSHPGFEPTLQRMSSLGDSFTTDQLTRLRREGLPERTRSRAANLDKILSRRVGQRSGRRQLTPAALLHLHAWVGRSEDPLATRIGKWAWQCLLAAKDQEGGRKALQKASEKPGSTGAEAFLHEAIQADARRLLR